MVKFTSISTDKIATWWRWWNHLDLKDWKYFQDITIFSAIILPFKIIK
jgi:hypothetical protein